MRVYLIRHYNPEHNTEEYREYEASCLTEALAMAERAQAGICDDWIGIHPDDYQQARNEGIAFNEADGLLI